MTMTNIAQIVRRQAVSGPDKIALVFEGERWSYARLDREIDRFARGLDSLGLAKGSVVAIFLESLPDLVIAYLGSLRGGYVANIINGSLKGPEAHFILADSDSRVLITDESRRALLEGLEPLPLLDHVILAGEEFRRFLERAADDGTADPYQDDAARGGRWPAGGEREDALGEAPTGVPYEPPIAPGEEAGRLSTLMYTSGTTGRPKGVMLSHRNILDNALRFGKIHFGPSDRLVIGAPLFHCWGLINGLLGVFSVGGTAVIIRRFQTEPALDLVQAEQATQFLGVAAMYNFMLKSPRAREALRSLKVVHSAAAPTPVELIERLRGDFGIQYAESYGLTETSPVITTAPYDETRPGSCGKAMGDTELKVVSPDGKELARGEIGELWARGTAIMLGYWRREDATREAITPEGWFKTGDIVRMDDDGYVYIVDRKKDMINVAGEKVYPREVEEVLYTHPKVADATVIGVPHADKGEVPKAFIVPRDGATLDPAEIIAYCKSRLASFKVPYEMEIVTEIPRSASGKILRRILREQEGGGAKLDGARNDGPASGGATSAGTTDDRQANAGATNAGGAGSYQDIVCEVRGEIAVVTMNRPEKRNALSLRHMEELIDCLSWLGETPGVRAIILQGNGPAFCSGHDLREMTGRDESFYRQLFDTCTRLMETIQGVPQPVIAQVHGIATAAGCQLVATCDLAVASESAAFATPGVKIGLFCSTPMVALTRAIGRKKALEMLLTGEPLSAREALVHGLVNRVVPGESLAQETEALARKIAAASALTIRTGKQAFYRQIELEQREAYAYAKEVMTENALAADAQEGICAFLEKRSPVWHAS